MTPAIAWKPEPYQFDSVKFIIEKKQVALWLDPGLGKTSISLAGISYLLKTNKIKKALVIAPLRVCQLVWQQEIEKWADFNYLKSVVLHGSKKERLLYSDAQVYIINYEGLAWLYDRWQCSPVFDLIVFDEISKLKNAATKRFKLVKSITQGIRYRIGLTGSPASNSLIGLFSQMYAIDGGRTFGKYITHFRAKYFYKSDYEFEWHILPHNEKALHKAIEPRVMRLRAEDYIRMPSLIEHRIVVDLPPAARKTYKELEDHFIAELSEGTITAANAAVKTMKLRQVTSGALYNNVLENGEREVITLHTSKIDALREIIDELQGKPLLVLYEYVHEHARLLEALGSDTPCLGSGTTSKQADIILGRWNAGLITVLLGQPQSMGHGLNLQGSSQHICFMTTPWSYELYDQVIRRIRRRGCQYSHVFAYHIVAKNTIDDAVLYKLKNKKNGQDRLMNAVNWYRERLKK